MRVWVVLRLVLLVAVGRGRGSRVRLMIRIGSIRGMDGRGMFAFLSFLKGGLFFWFLSMF